MKRLPFALLLAPALLAAPSGAGQAQAQAGSSAAAAMWDAMQMVTWGVPYGAWQGAHREAACEPFTAPSDTVIDAGAGGAEYWSDHCRHALPSAPSLNVNADWLFYATSPRDPVVAGLEQFRASADGVPVDQLASAYRELSNDLSTLYGPAQTMRDVDVDEFGAASWTNILRWRNAELETYLYLDSRFAPPRLRLQARHKALLDMLATGRDLDEVGLQPLESGTALDGQLAKGLERDFRDASALLAAPGRGEQEQEALLPALIPLLDAARTAGGDRRAMLLLAADRLAGRLSETQMDSPVWDEVRQRLAAYGVTFEWSELGGGWESSHDLLWRIWKEHRDTSSGGQAFLLLLGRGWNTRVGCPSGSDQFRDVIANGEPVLRTATPPDREQIVLFLAQSYETWWSLSQAGSRDTYADATQYRAGAAAARDKAIAYYNELLALPGTPQAAYAALELPRLKLGVDTGQRRFFCVYD
jgi:hypothetical protein